MADHDRSCAQALRRRAAELLLEADRLERLEREREHDAKRRAPLLRGEVDGNALAELLGQAHTLHLAFSTSTIKREPGESPLPRGRA